MGKSGGGLGYWFDCDSLGACWRLGGIKFIRFYQRLDQIEVN